MFSTVRIASFLFLLVGLVVQGCSSDEAPDSEGDNTEASIGSSEGTTVTNAEMPDDSTTVRVKAEMAELNDSGISGAVTMAHVGGALQVTYVLDGMPLGEHGIHIHENGSCEDGEDGTPGGAAGGHFNPDSSLHGASDQLPPARHVGDLGNIIINNEETAFGSFPDRIARLDGANSIVGRAVVIHAGPDDFVTQPSGNSGPRIACGVIEVAESE